jgi:hypothetical protein
MKLALSVAAPTWKRRIVNLGSRASLAWVAARAFYPLSAETIGEIMSGKVDAIFIANMQYSDEAGVQMASFFRIYDHKLGCSRRAESTKESQEWEYTD